MVHLEGFNGVIKHHARDLPAAHELVSSAQRLVDLLVERRLCLLLAVVGGPEIYVKARALLMERGMYSPLSFCYRNYTASRCYKLYNMLPGDEKEKLWNMLHDKYAEQLGWVGKNAAKFADGEVYEFVANVGLYNYKQYKRFAAHNKGQDTVLLDQKVAMAKNTKRVKSFFSRFKREGK